MKVKIALVITLVLALSGCTKGETNSETIENNSFTATQDAEPSTVSDFTDSSAQENGYEVLSKDTEKYSITLSYDIFSEKMTAHRRFHLLSLW